MQCINALKKAVVISLFFTNGFSNNVFLKKTIKNVPDEISFSELFKKSIDYNFDIKQIKNRKLITNEDISLEKLGYYPQVDFEYNNYKSSKDFERDNRPYKTRKESFSINTNLRVYDFNSKQAKIDILKKEVKIGDLSICENKIDSSLNLLSIYSSIQKSRASIVLLKKLVLEHRKKFEMKSKLYEDGLIGSTELILDKTTLLNAVKALNDEKEKKEYYTTILKIKTGYELKDSVRLAPLKLNYNAIDKYYLDSKIKRKILNEKINKIKKEIKYSKTSSMPTIDVYFTNNFYNEDSSDSVKYKNKRDYRVGFNIKWSLNSIFNYEAQKKRKLLEIKNEEILYEKAKQEAISEFKKRALSIKNYADFKKNSDERIYTLNDELENNTRMYNEGLEFKYKISDSKIKLLNEELTNIQKKFENLEFKKYITIILEKDNLCTHL